MNRTFVVLVAALILSGCGSDSPAERVEGYAITMPQNSLSPDEVDAVVAFIQELSAPN